MLTLLLLACAPHIPAPTSPVAALPVSPPPSSPIQVCRVDFATGTLPAGLVVARSHLHEPIPSVASGLLLRHPQGDWLVDGGASADFKAHLADVKGFIGFAMRQSASWTWVNRPVEAVRAAGGDPATLIGAIASHEHYDHLGGLVDLPGTPIWLPAEEIADAQRAADGEPTGALPAEARGLLPRAHAIAFTGPPVGPWTSSWDVYGDGSVLVVPMPGHTPGSVGTLIRLPSGRRVFHVGDTVWVKEGYEEREPKSVIAAAFDSDADGVALQIQRLWSLHQSDPTLEILPAHDSRRWNEVFAGKTCVQ